MPFSTADCCLRFGGEHARESYSSSGIRLRVAHRGGIMRIVYAHCCGLDLHKRSISACLLTANEAGETQQQVRRFSTVTNSERTLWSILVALRLCPYSGLEILSLPDLLIL